MDPSGVYTKKKQPIAIFYAFVPQFCRISRKLRTRRNHMMPYTPKRKGKKVSLVGLEHRLSGPHKQILLFWVPTSVTSISTILANRANLPANVTPWTLSRVLHSHIVHFWTPFPTNLFEYAKRIPGYTSRLLWLSKNVWTTVVRWLVWPRTWRNGPLQRWGQTDRRSDGRTDRKVQHYIPPLHGIKNWLCRIQVCFTLFSTQPCCAYAGSTLGHSACSLAKSSGQAWLTAVGQWPMTKLQLMKTEMHLTQGSSSARSPAGSPPPPPPPLFSLRSSRMSEVRSASHWKSTGDDCTVAACHQTHITRRHHLEVLYSYTNQLQATQAQEKGVDG